MHHWEVHNLLSYAEEVSQSGAPIPSAAPYSPAGPGSRPLPVVKRIHSEYSTIGLKIAPAASAAVCVPVRSVADAARTWNALDLACLPVPGYREEANCTLMLLGPQAVSFKCKLSHPSLRTSISRDSQLPSVQYLLCLASMSP